jgi:hypothetical protein
MPEGGKEFRSSGVQEFRSSYPGFESTVGQVEFFFVWKRLPDHPKTGKPEPILQLLNS